MYAFAFMFKRLHIFHRLFTSHLCLVVPPTGNDDSNEILTDRLARRVAQLSEAYECVRKTRVEMSTTDAVESALKNHGQQRSEVAATEPELVQYSMRQCCGSTTCIASTPFSPLRSYRRCLCFRTP